MSDIIIFLRSRWAFKSAKLALRVFREWSCTSLRPKIQIAQHAIDKYKMNLTGMTLSLEVAEILE